MTLKRLMLKNLLNPVVFDKFITNLKNLESLRLEIVENYGEYSLENVKDNTNLKELCIWGDDTDDLLRFWSESKFLHRLTCIEIPQCPISKITDDGGQYIGSCGKIWSP